MKKGIISIIGRSNTGKSSLFNLLSKKKYSIVTEKRNTTIRCVEGYIHDTNNIKIIDTPGPIINEVKSIYNINKLIYDSIKISDILIVVIDRLILTVDDFFILELIKYTKLYKILVINKIDKIKNKKLMLDFTNNIKNKLYFNDIIPTSTIKNININNIKNCISKFYEKHNINSDISLNNSCYDLVKDFIRKALLNSFDKEIPYVLKFNIKTKNITKKISFLDIDIIVKKIAQKKIIIGKNGKKINNLKKKIISYAKYNDFINLNDIKIEIIYDNRFGNRYN